MAGQQTLPLAEFKAKLEHGGIINRGKRKSARPIVTKKPMHIVFRATKGVLRNKRSLTIVKTLISKWSKYFNVRIYNFGIVGNHIHILLKAKTRQGFQSFMRTLPGQIAQKIRGAVKGQKLGEKFWEYLAYSRVVTWGRDFFGVKAYIFQNELEVLGVIPYQERSKRARAPCVLGQA